MVPCLGPPDKNIKGKLGGWVAETVSLQHYLESIVRELEKRMDQRFDSNNVALALSKEAIDARLTLLNELREVVADRLGDTISRRDHDKLVEQVQELQQVQANRDGRMWVVSGSVSTIAVLVMWIISHWKQ